MNNFRGRVTICLCRVKMCCRPVLRGQHLAVSQSVWDSRLGIQKGTTTIRSSV